MLVHYEQEVNVPKSNNHETKILTNVSAITIYYVVMLTHSI